MDVKLPDGTVVQNVPDGMSKADFTAKLKANGYDVSKLEAPAAAPAPEPSMMQKAATLTGQYGIAAPIVGAARTAMGGISEASDIAGSAVTEGASRAGLSPEVSAGLGTAANLGLGTVVAGGTGKAATGAAPALKGTAEWLMQSAIKPRIDARRSGDWLKARDTLFNSVRPASLGTVEKAESKVGELENSIQSELEKYAKAGVTIDKDAVASSLDVLRKDTALKLDKAKNLKDIKAAQDRFNEGIDEIRNLKNIPVDLANKIKQSFYKEVEERSSGYQPGANLTYYDKSEKKLAGNIREQLSDKVPSITPSLKAQSELLNVIEVLKPQLGVEGNKNIMGLAALSPTMQGTLAFMLDRYPWFKSWLAQGLYHGQERIPQALVGTGTAAVEAAQTRK